MIVIVRLKRGKKLMEDRMNKFPMRGQIFLVDDIPCVILSNNIANQVASYVIVAPIADRLQAAFMFEIPIEIANKPKKILVDQIRTLDKTKLRNQIGVCNSSTMDSIEEKLKTVLALN